MIVVDAAVLAYFLLPGERTAEAERARQRDPHWIAPLQWRSEVRNVLATLMRAGQLDLEPALAAMALAERMMRGRTFDVPSDRVLRLASASGCTAYDCEYVALADDVAAPLVTTDRQVLDAYPNLAVPLDVFGAAGG